ncbi:hypothetical protein [Aliikangiella sp. IMCC44359]|uniref:hypothetical protein n=1 Tax=Aliikangiella sp. IMCC44359 TaxID=3459125 RepID=UPI00403B1DF0
MSLTLTKNQISSIEREGERIKAYIKRFVSHLPNNARTTGSFAKWCGVSRSTAQRLLQMSKPSYNGFQVICGLPSPAGISRVIEKLADRNISEEGIMVITSANELLYSTLHSLTMSQNQLKNAFDTINKANDSGVDQGLSARKKLYELNQQLCKESIQLSVGVDCVTPNKHVSDYLSEVVIAYRQGVKFLNGSRSFVQSFVGNEKNYHLNQPTSIKRRELHDLVVDSTFQFLLEDLTSPSAVDCFTGHGLLGNSQVYNLSEANDFKTGGEITLGHIDRTSQTHPLTSKKQLDIHGIECHSPTQKMILISLLEKSLASKATARTGLYTSSQKAQEDLYTLEDNWNDRFYTDTPLLCFSPAEDSLAEKLKIPEVHDLIESALEANQLSKENSVGYCLVVDYPPWLSTYRIYFEYELN